MADQLDVPSSDVGEITRVLTARLHSSLSESAATIEMLAGLDTLIGAVCACEMADDSRSGYTDTATDIGRNLWKSIPIANEDIGTESRLEVLDSILRMHPDEKCALAALERLVELLDDRTLPKHLGAAYMTCSEETAKAIVARLESMEPDWAVKFAWNVMQWVPDRRHDLMAEFLLMYSSNGYRFLRKLIFDQYDSDSANSAADAILQNCMEKLRHHTQTISIHENLESSRCLVAVLGTMGRRARKVFDNPDEEMEFARSRLIELNETADLPIRVEALWSLARGEFAGWEDIISDALNDGQEEVRAEAINILAEFSPGVLALKLPDMVKDVNCTVRASAIRHYGRMFPLDGRKAAMKMLDSPDDKVGQAATEVLMNPPECIDDQADFLLGPEARDVGTTEGMGRLLEALMQVAPHRVSELLEGDFDWELKLKLVREWQSVDVESVLAVLKGILDEEKEDARFEVVETLVDCEERIPHKQLMELVQQLLADPSSLVRQATLVKLADTACSEEISRLCLEALEDTSWVVRFAALELLLKKFESPPSTDTIVKLLDDPDDDVREMALDAASEMLPHHVVREYAIAALHDDYASVRRTALGLLVGDDGSEVLEEILPLARDEDWYIRAEALQALAKFDDMRVFSEIVSASNDVDCDVKKKAMKMLEGGGDHVAVLRRLRAEGREDLWKRTRRDIEWANDWIRKAGGMLLGRRVKVSQYRQGIGRTATSSAGEVLIEVSDTPVTSGHVHGRQIMMGIGLHELGHHLYDIGARGHRTMRGIARSEGIGEIYDILCDERLERKLRSRREEWGVYLDRVSSYAFNGNTHEISLTDYAKAVGLPPGKAQAMISKEELPGAWAELTASESAKVVMRDIEVLMVPGLVSPLVAFLAVFRCGFNYRVVPSARVKGAIEEVPRDLKDVPHRELLQVSRRIAESLGIEAEASGRKSRSSPDMSGCMTERARSMSRLGELRSAMLRVMRKLEDLSQLPDSMRRGAAGIRRASGSESSGRSSSVSKGGYPSGSRRGFGQQINLGSSTDYNQLAKDRNLEFDPQKHGSLVRPLLRHIRKLKPYFQRLGLRLAEEGASRGGRRLDMATYRKALMSAGTNIMVRSYLRLDAKGYIGVLIDRSSSMDGEKIRIARSFGGLLVESAGGLRGLEGHVSAFDHDTFYHLGDFRRNAIATLEAGGGNNDAGALDRAARLALASGARNMLLVMISDGMPTECSIESLSKLVGHLTHDIGIACVQVAVDEVEYPAFPDFVDLSSCPMEEAVTRFGKLLVQKTQSWRQT